MARPIRRGLACMVIAPFLAAHGAPHLSVYVLISWRTPDAPHAAHA